MSCQGGTDTWMDDSLINVSIPIPHILVVVHIRCNSLTALTHSISIVAVKVRI